MQATENGVYIWQKKWNNQIAESILKVEKYNLTYYIFAGDISYENKKWGFRKISVVWKYLKNTKKIILVFRITQNAAAVLNSVNSEKFIEGLKLFICDIVNQAKEEEVAIQGIQIDYDCPSKKLAGYKKLLKVINRHFFKSEISITALPDWLDYNEFTELAGYCDYYVMQLHSFDIPKNNAELNITPEIEQVKKYIKLCLKVKIPFFVALPTYGYEVNYNDSYAVTALRAENTNFGQYRYFKKKIVAANIEKTLQIKKYLENLKIKLLKGIIWFRLPVENDIFNWSLKTFSAVMENCLTKSDCKIILEKSKDGAIGVFIENAGEANSFTENICGLNLKNSRIESFDLKKGFYLTSSNSLLISKPILAGQRIYAGWIRLKNNSTNE